MKKLVLIAFAFIYLASGSAQTVTRLVGTTSFQDSLWVFDSLDFAIMRHLAPTPATGGAITGINGIAKNPLTNEIFVICKQSAVTGRMLGKLDLATGVVTMVGNLGDNFSSITFNSSGTLYGVTGDGATVPETAYIINTNDATTTLLTPLGAGVDGEIICFNPTDNMIYHWSGNGTVVYEKFDTLGNPPINIPVIGTPGGETFGMVHVSGNYFIGSNISSGFQRWYADGSVSAPYGNTAPDDIRGTVLVTCPRLITGTASYCPGDSTALTMSAAGSYQWYQNGTLIPGATNATYYATTAASYNCMVSDVCGTDTAAAAVVVTQNTVPVVTLSGNPNLCPAATTILTGSSGGTHQWYYNGVAIPGATGTSYTATLPGVYNMTKTNTSGCSDSAAVGITVVVVAAPIVAIGNDTAFCSGNSLTLDAQNAGDNYLWNDASTAQTLNVVASGNYSVTVTNGSGCSTADTISVVVNALPTVDLGADTTQCGGSVVLDAMNTGSTYVWNDASTAQTLSASATGMYYVNVTDMNGCSSADTIDVTIHSLPTLTFSLTDTTCVYSASISLSATPAGGTFSGTGVTGSSFSPSAAGLGNATITYDYTDTNGCSNSANQTINVDPCTGINEFAGAALVSIYPNPASNLISVDLSSMNQTNLLIELTDVTGKLILKKTMNGGSVIQLELNSVDAGIYNFTVKTKDGSVSKRLVIKK